MSASELVYFHDAHLSHIALYYERMRLARIAVQAAEAMRLRTAR